MLADIIFIVFFCLMVLGGRKIGFVRSLLGTFSFLICGALTVVAYNYADKIGVVSAVAAFLKSVSPEEVFLKLEALGISGYIVNAVIAVLIYFLIKIVYGFAVRLIDIAAPKLINSTLGGIFGGLKAIAAAFAILAIIYSVRNTCDVTAATDVIENSRLVSKLYENNILLKLI